MAHAGATLIEYEWEQTATDASEDGSTGARGAHSRIGTYWVAEEYQVLVDALVDGASEGEVAALLGRTRGAITSRLKRMIPENAELQTTLARTFVNCVTRDPRFDWREHVRATEGSLLSYADIRALNGLDAQDPAALIEAAKIAQTTPDYAAGLLRKFGQTPDPAHPKRKSPRLPVKNLLGDRIDHLPSRAHRGDAGLDLRYAGTSPLTITSREHVIVPTGVAIAVPEGFAGLVTPRSGLAAKHGLTIVNSPGVIDHGYTGEVKVMLITLGQDATATLDPGDRIAQLILTPVSTPDIELVDDLDSSERGDGGLGSTGRA